MVWGVYLRLERALTEHLEDQNHKDLLKQILEWLNSGGAEEVERRFLDRIEQITGQRDGDGQLSKTL